MRTTTKWILPVEPWSPLIPGRKYRTRVARINPKKSTPGVEVTLEHLSRGQVGRQQKLLLTLPLRHGTLAARLLEAGGVNLTEGSQVAPEDAVGTIIAVRFGPMAESGELQPITFESTSSKESKHA